MQKACKEQPYELGYTGKPAAVKVYRVDHEVHAAGIKHVPDHRHKNAVYLLFVQFHFCAFRIIKFLTD